MGDEGGVGIQEHWTDMTAKDKKSAKNTKYSRWMVIKRLRQTINTMFVVQK
jgi:hypothetical protein